MIIKSSNIAEMIKNYTYGTRRKQSGWNPLLITKAYDCYFEDSEGKKYLDFSSQLMCSNLGHSNKRIAESVYQQLISLEYIKPGYATEIRAKVSLELKSVLPDNLSKYFFGSSGTDANEADIKLIRLFHRKDKKIKIISNYNSYHGSTMGSISLTGDFRRLAVDDIYHSTHIVHDPPPYCYRCPFNLKYPECNLACADYLEYIIRNEGNVGGIFLEPVTGTNGVVIPPNRYLKREKRLFMKRNRKIKDIMHKLSKAIVKYAKTRNIDTIIIGHNNGWKQSANIGRINNQNFVQIPFNTLINQIKYKAEEAGIQVIIKDEEQTSKCSFLDNESIEHHDEYMGKRIKRGIFRSKDGILMHADLNAVYNIIRKAFSEAFADGIEGIGLYPKSLSISEFIRMITSKGGC